MAVALSPTVLGFTGYAQSGIKTSMEAIAGSPTVFTLAHGLNEARTIYIAMTEFADRMEKRTSGRIRVRILPNSQLGSENESMEQLMASVISMTKVSASGLTTYNESYHTFGLPYIFDDVEDFYHVMGSSQMQDFFLSSSDDGFVTLTYYTSGACSFYTKDKAVRTLADLKDLKIRVQDTKSQTDMMRVLSSIPVAMSYGGVYASLQTGIIDDTENNEAALTTDEHGKIYKVYSTDQHVMIPDVVVMSVEVWRTISPQGQRIILKATHESTESHEIAWDAVTDEATQEASIQMGVEFVSDVDKNTFHQATSGMINEYCVQYPGVRELLDIVDSVG